MAKKETGGSEGHENHQQEGCRTGSHREGGYSAREVPAAEREAIDTEDLVSNLSLASQDTSAHPSPFTTDAKGKGKAIVSVQPANDEGAEGALTGRDNQSKRRGSAAKLNAKSRPETRRARSGDGLRRSHSGVILRLPRGGLVATKKRQGTEQGTQEAASTGADSRGQEALQRSNSSKVPAANEALPSVNGP